MSFMGIYGYMGADMGFSVADTGFRVADMDCRGKIWVNPLTSISASML